MNVHKTKKIIIIIRLFKSNTTLKILKILSEIDVNLANSTISQSPTY